jgi:DNA-binding PadR family transcriptional regulator
MREKPFKELIEDLEYLEKIGLIKIEKKLLMEEEVGEWKIEKTYSLTEKGKEVAKKIFEELDDKTKEALRKIAELNKLSNFELDLYIYNLLKKEREGGENKK